MNSFTSSKLRGKKNINREQQHIQVYFTTAFRFPPPLPGKTLQGKGREKEKHGLKFKTIAKEIAKQIAKHLIQKVE